MAVADSLPCIEPDRAIRLWRHRLAVASRFWLPVIFITVVAGGLRLPALATYPQAFTQDEMVLGYDAWSIWQTGRDHHGELLPVFFRSYNDYVPPVAVYLTAPFVGTLGLDEATTRLPFALLGIATVVLVAVLGRLWFGSLAGILAALFLAIDPWHVNYSRMALPGSTIPFFLTAALVSFTLATNRLKLADRHGQKAERTVYLLLILSGVCFGLLTGTYPTMKIQAPLLLAPCLLAALPLLWRHRTLLMGWLGSYAICISPLLVVQLTRWNQVQIHYNQLSALNDKDWLIQALRLYADHFSPGALLFNGFGGYAVHRPLYIGELFWLEGPLWIAAFVGLTRPRVSIRVAFSLTVLIGVWLVVYPIGDSLTRGAPPSPPGMAGQPHEVRSYDLLPLPELLAGFGLVVIWRKLARFRWGRFALSGLAFGGMAVLLFFCAMFLSNYFSPPLLQTDQSPADFPLNVGFRPIMDKVSSEIQSCDLLWIAPGNQIYMYYLFFTRYPPPLVQQFDLTRTTDEGWLNINNFGQVRIGAPDPFNPTAISRPDCTGQPQRVFFVARSEDRWPGWQEVAVVRNQSGAAVWRLTVKALKYFTDGRINDGDVGASMAGYCLPDGSLDVRGIDGSASHDLFTVSHEEIQHALRQATTSGQHQLIRDQGGRQLWALSWGQLQLHDARGIVYDYVFDGDRCGR